MLAAEVGFFERTACCWKITFSQGIQGVYIFCHAIGVRGNRIDSVSCEACRLHSPAASFIRDTPPGNRAKP